MASLCSTARIGRPADEVWQVVSDPAGISAWFPGIEQATAAEGTRRCTLAGGHRLEEDVVNIDEELRRFQYRITGGMPVEHAPDPVVLDASEKLLDLESLRRRFSVGVPEHLGRRLLWRGAAAVRDGRRASHRTCTSRTLSQVAHGLLDG